MFKAVFCLLACLVLISSAQLTFTSSWGGKRAAAVAGSLNCRNDDAIAAVYKLIQNEAERLLFCQKP